MLVVEQSYLSRAQSMKVGLVGHLFLSLYQMFLKKKKICTLVIQEQSIIVKNVAVITDMFLMMDLNLQERDIVIMVFV